MDDNSIMPFGKFKGQKMANVPASYLLWCINQPWCRGELHTYITNNMTVLMLEADKEKR